MATEPNARTQPSTQSSSTRRMRCLAVGVIRRADGAVLLQTGYDSNKDERFYRALGGGIEFGEHSAKAFAREIGGELGAEVFDVRLVGWIENIFEYEGRPGHEIMAVYEAKLADPSFYTREVIALADQLRSSDAVWVQVNSETTIYPKGLRDLIV